MADARPSPGRRLLAAWKRLSPLPGGRWIFGRLIGFMVPYTGSIRPIVVELRPGYARVQIRDRRAVRQHLGSVHAIALANLAEFTSGSAMITGLPDGMRGIVTRISIEYFKKARGLLTAECTCEVPSGHEQRQLDVVATVRDGAGDAVARATVTWLVGPTPGSGQAAGAAPEGSLAGARG
jgi:acyl-coenzyme A thioesterase PaaI-like protein